jgi:hypothetical protein
VLTRTQLAFERMSAGRTRIVNPLLSREQAMAGDHSMRHSGPRRRRTNRDGDRIARTLRVLWVTRAIQWSTDTSGSRDVRDGCARDRPGLGRHPPDLRRQGPSRPVTGDMRKRSKPFAGLWEAEHLIPEGGRLVTGRSNERRIGSSAPSAASSAQCPSTRRHPGKPVNSRLQKTLGRPAVRASVDRDAAPGGHHPTGQRGDVAQALALRLHAIRHRIVRGRYDHA